MRRKILRHITAARGTAAMQKRKEEITVKNQNKHKKIWILAVVVLCAVAAVGVADAIQKRSEAQPKDEISVGKDEIFAMDTVMDLTVYAKDTEKVLSAGRKLITQYEQHFSVNIEDSDISKCNRAEGKPVKVSDETYDLIRISKEMTEKTDGLFDISIYPIVNRLPSSFFPNVCTFPPRDTTPATAPSF